MAAGMSTAATINFTDPAIQANPIPVYERLRAESPVVWNGSAQGWLVSRYDDVVGLFNDPRMSSQRVDATFRPLPDDVQEELTPLKTVLLSRMLLSDPPRHTRLRKLVMQPFSAKASQGRRDRIQAFCDDFLDRVIDSLRGTRIWCLVGPDSTKDELVSYLDRYKDRDGHIAGLRDQLVSISSMDRPTDEGLLMQAHQAAGASAAL